MNERRTVELRTALFGGAGSLVALILGLLSIASFFELTPAAMRAKERRIMALEQAQSSFPTRPQIESLAVSVAKLEATVSDLNKLLLRYGITEDNLVPRPRERR